MSWSATALWSWVGILFFCLVLPCHAADCGNFSCPPGQSLLSPAPTCSANCTATECCLRNCTGSFSWATCSTTCGPGVTTGTYNITSSALNGGAACPYNTGDTITAVCGSPCVCATSYGTCPVGMEKRTNNCAGITCTQTECCKFVTCPATSWAIFPPMVFVGYFNDSACSSQVESIHLPLSWGSSVCSCAPGAGSTPNSNPRATTNFKCNPSASTVTYTQYSPSNICNNYITHDQITVGLTCTFLSSLYLYAKVLNYTACAQWGYPAVIQQQVAAVRFDDTIASVTGYPMTVNLANLSLAQRRQIVNNVQAMGTQVFLSDARIEMIIDTANPPKDATGSPVTVSRSSSSLVRIRDCGTGVAVSVVSIVDPSVALSLAGINLPVPPPVGTSGGTWMSDLLVFTRFDSLGNVVSSGSTVQFDLFCNSAKYLGVWRFDLTNGSLGANLTGIPVNSVVYSGGQWCTVTSSATSGFIAYQQLITTSSSNGAGQLKPARALALLVVALLLVLLKM